MKKRALQKDLQNAQKQLNGINTGSRAGLLCRTHSAGEPVLSSSLSLDDISGMIDEAKRKAADANSTASTTMDRLNTIQQEIDKIKVTPGNSNLGNVLNDVDQTGENLCVP